MPKIRVRAPSGETGTVDASDLKAARRAGFAPIREEDYQFDEQLKKYGGSLNALGALGAGVLSTATLGLSDYAISEAGGRERLQAYRELYPEYKTAGEIVGGALPTAGFGVVGKGGAALEAGITGLAKGGNLATRMLARAGGLAARGVAEGAAFGAGSGLSEAAIDNTLDAESLGEKVWAGVKGGAGMGLVFGLGIGGAAHGLGAGAKGLLKKLGARDGTVETALTKGAEDVKSGLREHGAADPIQTGAAETVSVESPKPPRKPPPLPEQVRPEDLDVHLMDRDLNTYRPDNFTQETIAPELPLKQVQDAQSLADWYGANSLADIGPEGARNAKFQNFLKKSGREFIHPDEIYGERKVPVQPREHWVRNGENTKWNPDIEDPAAVKVGDEGIRALAPEEFSAALSEFKRWERAGEPPDWFSNKDKYRKRLTVLKDEVAPPKIEEPAKPPTVDAPAPEALRVDTDAGYKPERLSRKKEGPFQHKVELEGETFYATPDAFEEIIHRQKRIAVSERNAASWANREKRLDFLQEKFGANHVHNVISQDIAAAILKVKTPADAAALADDFATAAADSKYIQAKHLDEITSALRQQNFTEAADRLANDTVLHAEVSKRPSVIREGAAAAASAAITAAGWGLGGVVGGLAARPVASFVRHLILGSANLDAIGSLAAKVDISMESSLARMARSAKNKAIDSGAAFRKRAVMVQEHRQALNDATQDPETTRRYLNAGMRDIGGTHPAVRDAAASTALRAQAVLREFLPAGDIPSAAQTARFLRVTEIIKDPSIAFRKIEQGKVTKDEINALKRVYPKMYKQLADRVLQEQIELQAQGKQLSYKNRLALSVMMDMPIEKTLNPNFLTMVSETYAKMSPPAQPPQSGGTANRKSPELDFSPQKEHKDDRPNP